MLHLENVLLLIKKGGIIFYAGILNSQRSISKEEFPFIILTWGDYSIKNCLKTATYYVASIALLIDLDLFNSPNHCRSMKH